MRDAECTPRYALRSMLLLALGLALLSPIDAAARPGERDARTGDDVRAWLDRLRADSAAERARAQRWLGRHLAEADLDLVRAAAATGDAEVRQRLALALADDDKHVSIAAQLAASGDASAAEVGRSALVESIARWSPGWTKPSLPREETLAKLAESLQPLDAPVVAIDPRVDEKRLDLALEELARLVPGAPQLVLDPAWARTGAPRDSSSPRWPSTEIEGTFERVLGELLTLHQADAEGFDPPGAEGELSRPWIRVRRPLSTTHSSAADQVAAWCEGLLREPDPSRRAACARAIASTGWPAGIAWLEARWRAGSDDAALDGVLLAAGRGLVAPSLARVEVQGALYRSLRAAAVGERADPARADAIARAIGAAGPLGPAGEDLALLAVQDLLALSPREQWLRLVAVEGMRPVSADAPRSIDALLAAPGTPPAVAFQALRACSAIRGANLPAPSVRDAPAILAWADTAGRADECARLLASLGVPPPSGARGPTRSFAELEWTVATGDASAAAGLLLALAAPVVHGGIGLEALARPMRSWVLRGTGARLEAAIAAARAIEGADADRLDRLALLSGAASADLRARLRALAMTPPSSREDLLCVAALAAAPGGDDARRVLVRSVTTYALLDDVVAALDLALSLLRAARDDLAERDLIQSVRRVARDGPPELRLRFLVGTWPVEERKEVLRGRDSDRSLATSSLP